MRLALPGSEIRGGQRQVSGGVESLCDATHTGWFRLFTGVFSVVIPGCAGGSRGFVTISERHTCSRLYAEGIKCCTSCENVCQYVTGTRIGGYTTCASCASSHV